DQTPHLKLRHADLHLTNEIGIYVDRSPSTTSIQTPSLRGSLPMPPGCPTIFEMDRLCGWSAVLLALFPAQPAFAHEDPAGDLYPEVRVEGGNFAVYFTSSFPYEKYDDSWYASKHQHRMIFSPEGTLLTPRHKPPKGTEIPVDRFDLKGTTIRIGEEEITFTGLEGYLLRSGNGTVTRHLLPWPDKEPYVAESAVATPEGIAVNAIRMEPYGAYQCFWFRFGIDAPPETVPICEPLRIYDFAVSSNIVLAAGRFYVASMVEGPKLELWSWKPGEPKGRVETLDSPADWNCHLHMAAIGNRLCLAYHCATRQEGNNSRIFTVFRTAAP
ncbi:MAG: hypothetical protein ABL994_25600, partial [Verrucomicrobiales bacterium]